MGKVSVSSTINILCNAKNNNIHLYLAFLLLSIVAGFAFVFFPCDRGGDREKTIFMLGMPCVRMMRWRPLVLGAAQRN